jgi:hypothetical protein
MIIFKPGDIVKLDITNRRSTFDGLAVGGCGSNEDELVIFQRIDLEKFPSCNDFKGKTSTVKHDSYALILRYVGRPFRMNVCLDVWQDYDVYEIITSKLNKRQVFKFNLKKAF